MQIYFIATVLKMEFYLLILDEEKIKELSEYAKEKRKFQLI